jgi:RHS repeat-associated protein
VVSNHVAGLVAGGNAVQARGNTLGDTNTADLGTFQTAPTRAASPPVSQVDTQYAPSGRSPLGQVSYARRIADRVDYVYLRRARQEDEGDPGGWQRDAVQLQRQPSDDLPRYPNNFTNSTTYTYNALDKLTNVSSQTASGTQTRTFNYTGLDLTSETNPENGAVTYTYDGAHHMLSKTDAIGQQTQYTYDPYGRLTAKYCYPLVSGVPTLDPNQTVLYYYDTNPHEPTFSSNSQGRLTAVQMNTSMWYEYNYSVPGRVTNQRLQVWGHDYDASYSWDTEGRLLTQTWPSAVSPSTGPQYTFQYDSMGRVGSMLDSNNNTQATASYGVANELLGLNYFGIAEQRTYNNMFQLIHQYAPNGEIDMQYIYTAGQNNGRIAQSIDGYLPETVNYTYDSLNRLSNAAATNGAFSQSYTYDGFGNLTSKSAAGFYPAYSATFNPANNRQNGVAYDANGNQTAQGTYDVSNRLVTSSIGQSYAYDYRGKRIVKWTGGAAEVYFYGIDGKKMTTLTCDASLNCSSAAYNVSFAGKLVQSKGNTVVTDRLGSVRWSSLGGVTGFVYFPYGEERTITPANLEKFGTYTRDSSGQDYADQRYYGVGTGRFWSTDPSGAAVADPRNPITWNRYAYVDGDPVNSVDPTGLDPYCGPGQTWDGEGCITGGITGGYFSLSAGNTSVNLAAGETSYVLGTVVPAYLNTALNSNPVVQQVVFPAASAAGVATSETIFYMSSLSTSTLSGITSALTLLPYSIPGANTAYGGTIFNPADGTTAAYTQLSVTVSVPGTLWSFGGSATVDNSNGNVWVGWTGSYGPSLPVSFSLVNGSGPSQGTTGDFLQGFSLGWSAGGPVGVGGQWSNTSNGIQYSTEVGIYTPQAGPNFGWNYCIAPFCKQP